MFNLLRLWRANKEYNDAKHTRDFLQSKLENQYRSLPGREIDSIIEEISIYTFIMEKAKEELLK